MKERAIGSRSQSLALLSAPALLLSPELGNLLLDRLLDAGLELGAIPQLEQDLEPDEERGQEDGLDEVIQQGWGAALKGAVAEELQEPGHYVHDDGHLVRGGRVRDPQGVGGGGARHAEGREDGAGDGLQEDVEATPDEGCQCAEVGLEVGDLERRRDVEEGPRVGCLAVVVRYGKRRWQFSGDSVALTRQKAEKRISGTQTTWMTTLTELWW